MRNGRVISPPLGSQNGVRDDSAEFRLPVLRPGAVCALACLATTEIGNMEWTSPTYAEIKMDAEIGSYQEDSESSREPLALAGNTSEAPSET
jgi:hypothetical protein